MPQDLPPTKATVLISGNGSNLQALIDAKPLMPYLTIVRVISNKGSAYGLKRAENATPPIPTTVHNLVTGKYKPLGGELLPEARKRYDADLAALILKDAPDIVICAGFLHILTPKFLEPLAEKKVPVINLHPALPQKYDGMHAIERAFKDFKAGKLENNTTGIMIHYVISEVDRGEPVIIRQIKCSKGETLEQFEERVHEQEHELIVEGAQLAISNLWRERSKST